MTKEKWGGGPWDQLIGKQTGRTGGSGAEGSETPYLPHVAPPSIIPHYLSCIKKC